MANDCIEVEISFPNQVPVVEVEASFPNEVPVVEVEFGFTGPAGQGFTDDTVYHTVVDESRNAPIASITRINDSDGEPTLISQIDYTDWRSYANSQTTITYYSDDTIDTVTKSFDYEGDRYLHQYKLTWLNEELQTRTILQDTVTSI